MRNFLMTFKYLTPALLAIGAIFTLRFCLQMTISDAVTVVLWSILLIAGNVAGVWLYNQYREEERKNAPVYKKMVEDDLKRSLRKNTAPDYNRPALEDARLTTVNGILNR